MLADPAALDEVVRAIDASKKLALITGAQIEEDGANREVVALAEKLNADVYAEPIASRWAFPRSHRLFRGGLLPAQKPLADQLAGYDTVVVLGAPVFLYYAYVPGNAISARDKTFPDHEFAAGRRRQLSPGRASSATLPPPRNIFAAA